MMTREIKPDNVLGMKINQILLLIPLLLMTATSQADPRFKTPAQVAAEMNEDGHMPQGLKPRMYHKLKEVIPVDTQQKLRAKKRKKATEQKDHWWTDYVIRNQKNQPVPNVVDLRAYDTPIRSQWDGTCTAHGLTAGTENLLRRNPGKHDKSLSVRYFWNQYKQYSAQVAIQTATTNKQVEEQYWPEEKTRPLIPISELKAKADAQLLTADYLEDDTKAMVASLSQGYPVYIAMSVPSDMASCRSSIRFNTAVTSGGHALAVVGYGKDKSIPGGYYLILKNSWGTDCGDHGYQYLPLALCERQDMYCIAWSLKEAS